MAARTKARKRAVDVLYEADMRGDDRLAVLRERLETADPAGARSTRSGWSRASPSTPAASTS